MATRQFVSDLDSEKIKVFTAPLFDESLPIANATPQPVTPFALGAFVSTPMDLVKLGSAMMKPRLLKAETIAAFQTPTRLASGASTTYALGWTVGSVHLAGAPARMLSHRGSPSGGTVSLLTFPDLGIAIAAAANTTDAGGVNPFALKVAEAFSR